MSNHNTPSGLNHQWLKARLEMLLSAQSEFNYEERVEGEVSEQTYAELETEVLNMYDALEHQREHQAAAKTWEEFAMDDIPIVCNQKKIVEGEKIGHSGIKEDKKDVIVKRARPEYLKNWTRGFARIINDLGLSVSVKKESGELYAIKRDPGEYDDPINDDIPKPE